MSQVIDNASKPEIRPSIPTGRLPSSLTRPDGFFLFSSSSSYTIRYDSPRSYLGVQVTRGAAAIYINDRTSVEYNTDTGPGLKRALIGARRQKRTEHNAYSSY